MMRIETAVALALFGAGLLVWAGAPAKATAETPASARTSARVILAHPAN